MAQTGHELEATGTARLLFTVKLVLYHHGLDGCHQRKKFAADHMDKKSVQGCWDVYSRGVQPKTH